MKIAILGFGLQGRSAYEYWRDGNEITVCDGKVIENLPKDVEPCFGPDHLKNLDRFDLIVRSPIVRPPAIVAANSPAILDKVTTVSNEFFRVCPTKKIVGVTGTKGKGTTSTLIGKMLEADGRRVHVGGNIGTPPLELLKNDIQPEDWVVLELANFQLIDLKYSPPVTVCLMVVPEHLDWHADQSEYVEAKKQLFCHQSANDVAVYYAKNELSKQVASASSGRKIPYYAPPGAVVEDGKIMVGDEVICQTSELKLLGKHNWQNVCAAVTAVWQLTQNVEALRSVLTSFSGLPFRIEFRREVDGVRYYNDSFASGPGSSVAAFEAVPGSKVMILGGFERGLPLDELGEAFKRHPGDLRKALLIGASGKRVAKEVFDKHGLKNYRLSDAKDMPAIVKEAAALAQPGDAVILSPAFASFDMFENFEERGRKFNQAVEAL